MKQRISAEDLSQLTPDQQNRLREWWKPHREDGDYFVNVDKETGNIPIFGSSVNGACDGYWNCECAIDDGEDPASRPEENALPLLSIGQLIQLLIKLQPYEDWECQFMFSENLCDELWVLVKRVL